MKFLKNKSNFIKRLIFLTKYMEILNELISAHNNDPKEGIDFKDVLEMSHI